MNKIVLKKQFSEKVYLFEIEAPLIAKSRKAGNFIIVRVGENGERVPLTIADADIERGTITIVVQKVGLSSTKLCSLNEGDLQLHIQLLHLLRQVHLPVLNLHCQQAVPC
jgi:glutamate synthase (NADPH) small chain